jgi:hypothetical protein
VTRGYIALIAELLGANSKQIEHHAQAAVSETGRQT